MTDGRFFTTRSSGKLIFNNVSAKTAKTNNMSPTHSTPADTSTSSLNHEESRLFSLDVLRGIALLGILVISIGEFGGFTTNEKTYYITGTHGGNYKLWGIVSILFEGKMRALFALVFGAGILLFLQKKEHPAPISPADAYIRRQLWLIAFGIFNAFVLLWPGDILFQYGVVGILLYAFTRMKAKGFFIAALVCTLVYCGKQYWNYSDDKKDYKKFMAVTAVENKFKADSTARAKKDSAARPTDTTLLKAWKGKKKIADSIAKKNDTLTRQQKSDKEKWEGTVKGLKYDPEKTKAENKAMGVRNYAKIWMHLMPRSQYKESQWLYRTGVWDIASLMFLGMALFSIGFFNGRFRTSNYLLLGIGAVIAGWALGWYRVHTNSIRLADYAKYVQKRALPYDLFFPIERILLATGYASLTLWLLRMHIFNYIRKGLAAAGRMAFTNYLLQSVICSFFFYGYGFGYFGHLKQWELYFMVAEIALVQVVFSVFWLRYFRLGPLEWLWRCLIYKKWLPNKR